MEFDKLDYWKAIVLYGLNASTYKMGFGISLINAARENKNEISWDDLSRSFLKNYETRLQTNPMPQLSNSSRLTEMEKITRTLQKGKIDRSQAIDQVGRNAFEDVVHRFHTIGMDNFGFLWLQLKLLFVIILTIYHFFLFQCLRKFTENNNSFSPKFYRIINEIPTVLLIGIILIIVFKPL